MDLGDRVLCASSAEPVGTCGSPPRRSVRAPVSGRLATNPVGDGLDAQAPQFPARFGMIRSSCNGAQNSRERSCSRKLVEELLHPAHVLDVVGGRAVHSGRAGTPVGPHPLPGHGQHSRIDDQVEQVVEPATRRTCPPCSSSGSSVPAPLATTGGGTTCRNNSTSDLLTFQSFGCGHAAALGHVTGFPGLGLLRRLRPNTHPSADGGPAPVGGWPVTGADARWFPRSLSSAHGSVPSHPHGLLITNPQHFIVASGPAHP